MKGIKKELALVASGVLLGAALATSAATATLTAQLSSQKFVVDGKPAQIEAYAINGSNYVRLRDVGKAVGFDVSYDTDNNAVKIDTGAPYTDEAAVNVVRLPTDGSKYVPKVGDVLLCDDGTLYEIKDTVRWENNVFAPGPLPELPAPTCDWSLFDAPELPRPEVRRFINETGDHLYVRNLYETRRMQYTIYNALGCEPSAWLDGKPLAKVSLTIPAEYEPYTGYFWPWRASEIEKQVNAYPNFRFRIEAWDCYKDHVFLQTQYYIYVG